MPGRRLTGACVGRIILAASTEEIRPMPRTAQSRTNLPQSLHRDLSLYALAAGAAGVSVLALAQPADAEVVYTEVHQIINHSQSYAIDLNHDGVTDFTIHNISFRCTRTFSYCPVFQLNVTPATPMNGVQEGFRTSYAAALLPGAEVGPSKPIKHGPAIVAKRNQPVSWPSVKNRRSDALRLGAFERAVEPQIPAGGRHQRICL